MGIVAYLANSSTNADTKSGFKILINDKNKPKDGYGLRPFGKTANVKEILRVGNLLFLNKIGPKIYDLILLEDDFKNTAYAFLVQDIKKNESKKINDEELSKFLKKIETLKFLQPAFRNIKNSYDFKIDNNSENIVKSANDKIMFLDDTLYEKMIHPNVSYLHLAPYNYKYGNMIEKYIIRVFLDYQEYRCKFAKNFK